MKEKPISARTKKLLSEHQIQLKKSLGQNFLTDSHVLDKIIHAASLTKKSGVIEIGPGIGALTERLAQAAGKVVAIEIDQRLIPILEDLFQNDDNVEIINADALTVDLKTVVAEHFRDTGSLHVVANLPYYVTSPILVRLLEERLPLTNIVIMIQKEVADRLKAAPGTKDYSSLSVLVQYYAEVEEVGRVPSHVFVPRPQVDSKVVCLTLRKEPKVRVPDEQAFFKMVRAAFNQRRKTLLNSLHSHLLSSVSKEELEKWMSEAGIDPKRRAETLDLEEFAVLAEVLDRKKISF
ncbi:MULTISPECIES: 16S rRNA (adenine(1518)-N(6)/adenine(1519)-N(6))-dimethyltransferase RsmA [Thermoactinomyces]|jgi:16S rRNA (adenine1518-N6/adenine1519-N6)-dimethyltransferase|uniref:Ribosomal RNA small subunit methyltransferase A n=1 Tax=Thermoactinomyces vulgaris TaxID=2026 RepID=A0ABS0QJD7_THEVU|nr:MULTISPECIES: 16S rRNA (adenine(1518)-N(6)/adenine(1519)-N(6))-dimethyltransferase RsmA [Thermoactinomyces]KFZ39467.1 16S rRNA methyltransferase [Thermoactinomyces sp. Gus2-1]KYQ85878.1 16S rRNA methyltransferase [Thermoactinomyces sp. AS95]MBA4552467.1 16S rRNA (adenine(1518)-N(6)/adenine(1519)-N(6))-dimethyltransferase RsmA [Thermoactinomyces vulgaris]MBA4596578.1 16S rRNA (adenine(1518)-N(6)/adenine(1519)-N(6))-dimethyltransferase RsmA [Thermoactinomyces vulgaris]MBH8584410.1 16S rRNA (a